MSLKFHVNPKTGTPGPCRALENCPFGGEEWHYESLDEARSSYEEYMNSQGFDTLVSLSHERSDWRSIPWEERKLILEEFARTLISQTSVKKRKKLLILWKEEKDVPERGKLGGAGFEDKNPRKRPHISLPELRLEALEETSAYEDIIHEIAHLEDSMLNDHGEPWREAAKRLAAKVSVIEWHDFPQGSILSPQEKFRLNFLWYQRYSPGWKGVCELDSSHEQLVRSEKDKNPTCYACDEKGDDGYLRVHWTNLKDPEAKKQWILDMIARERNTL